MFLLSWHLAAAAADVIIITITAPIIMIRFSDRPIIMAAAVITITTIITMVAGKQKYDSYAGTVFGLCLFFCGGELTNPEISI